MTDEREAMTDDAIILAMCKAHDAEEAAAIGEPSPWREDFDRDPDWAQARFLAMREAFDVCRAAHPRTGEPVAWPSDDEAILGTADELAERWAEKPAIRRMAQACASVFSKWASDDIISRFHEQMIALMKQSFVEGALHCRAHPVPGQDGWRAPRAAFVMEAKDGTGWRVQAGYERKEDAHLVADILSGCKPEQEAV